jgi:hypothetical protein
MLSGQLVVTVMHHDMLSMRIYRIHSKDHLLYVESNRFFFEIITDCVFREVEIQLLYIFKPFSCSKEFTGLDCNVFSFVKLPFCPVSGYRCFGGNLLCSPSGNRVVGSYQTFGENCCFYRQRKCRIGEVGNL